MKTISNKGKFELVLHPEISRWRKEQLVNQELFEDLREKGQLQNLVARRLPDGKVQLLAGYRRYLALKALGKKPWNMDIKILENVSDKEALLIAASENKKRINMSPVEEGRMFRSMRKLRMPIDEIAMRHKVSEVYVRNRLELLELPKEIQDMMENREIPMSYAKPISKLEKVGKDAQLHLAKEIKEGQDKYYGGIRSVEEAEEHVEKTLAKVKFVEELVAKYGPCPSCGSTNIEQDWTDEKLICKRCGHRYHRETKEPWEYFELKQKAKKLGLELDIGEGKAKLKPGDVQKIMEELKQSEEAEKPIKKTLRSTHTVSELLAPFIKPKNLHLIRVEGDRVEIKLIQDSRMHFTARRHNYKTGEKSQIRPRGAWNEDYRETYKRLDDFLKSLEVD